MSYIDLIKEKAKADRGSLTVEYQKKYLQVL